MHKITLLQKLRYHFDNSLSGGTVSLIGWLALITLIIILLASSLLVLTQWHPLSDTDPTVISLDSASLKQDDETNGIPQDRFSFAEAAWQSLMRSLDAGTVGGDAADDGNGWAFRIWGLVITLSGLFIVGSLISILSSGLEARLEELRKGHSFVCEENHTLILGWSPRIFLILTELAIANANVKKPRIVILANKDKIEMEDEIRNHVQTLGRTKVVCRSGSPIDLADLHIANPYNSKSIIILSPQDYADPDAQVIKMLLAITNHPNRRQNKYHIVAELQQAKHLEVAKLVGKDEVELVIPDDLIARITVQTSKQVGLSSVYKELLSFAGDEIYFKAEPRLIGKNYEEALASFVDSCLIGVENQGVIELNPKMTTPIRRNDQLIFIAQDDDTIKVSGTPHLALSLISYVEEVPELIERDIMLGWSQKSEAIIREMDHYAKSNTTLTIVGALAETQTVIEQLSLQLKNIQLQFIQGNTTERPFLDSLDLTNYAHVILLCDGHLDAREADSKTLLTLIHLRDIEAKQGESFSIVSEMMDSRNQALTEIAKADDFIVSDELAGLVLAQISENKKLSVVFKELFNADGAEIYLKPVENYVRLGQSVNFYTVVEAACRKNETAIGYRLLRQANHAELGYGVHINPDKSKLIDFEAKDKVIVLANS